MNELNPSRLSLKTLFPSNIRIQEADQISRFQKNRFQKSLIKGGFNPRAATEAADAVETGLVKVKGDPFRVEILGGIRDKLVFNTSKATFADIVSAELKVLPPRRDGAFGPILATVDSEAERIRRKNPNLAGLLIGVTEEAAFHAGQVLQGFIPEFVSSMRGVIALDPRTLAQGFLAQAPDKSHIANVWNGLLRDGTVDPNDAEESLYQAFDVALDDGEEQVPPDEPPPFSGEPVSQEFYEAGCSFERLDVLQPSFKSSPVLCLVSEDDKAVFGFRESGDEYQAVDVTYQGYPVESLLTPKDHVGSGKRVLEGYRQSLSADYLDDHFVAIRPKMIERFQHTTIMSELGQEANTFAFIKEKLEEKRDELTDELPKKAGEAAEAAIGTLFPGAGKLANSTAAALTKAAIDYVLAELFRGDKTDLFPSVTVVHSIRPGRNGKPKSEISLSLTTIGKDGKRKFDPQAKPDRVQYDIDGKAIKRGDGKLALSRRTKFNDGFLVTFEGASNDEGLRLPAQMQKLGHGETSCLLWDEATGGHGLHAIVTLENEEKTRKAMVALRAVVRHNSFI